MNSHDDAHNSRTAIREALRAAAVPAPSADPVYEADELLRQLTAGLGLDYDLTISYVGAFYIYRGHWSQISHRDEIGHGETLAEALHDALARGVPS